MYFTGTFLFYLTQRYKVGKATPILFGEVTVVYKVLVEKNSPLSLTSYELNSTYPP